MSSNITLTVFIPHLFDSLQEWNANFSFVPKTDMLVPLLNQFFEKKEKSVGFIDALYSIGGGQKCSVSPHAVTCYYYDFGKLPTEAVLLATPVHLQTGMADVTVDGLVVNDLSSTEKVLLKSKFNQYFKRDNLRLEYSSSGRWYVLLPFVLMPKITYPVERVLGNSLFPFLHNTKQLEWNRLLNELQMLLYDSTINQKREAKGLRPISSFWLWGNAKCNVEQTFNSMQFVQSIVAGNFTGKAFANILHAKWYSCFPDVLDGDTVVIIDDLMEPSLCNDIDKWQYALTRIETDYIKSLTQFCLANNNVELIINTCDGRKWIKNNWYQRLLVRKKMTLLDYVI